MSLLTATQVTAAATAVLAVFAIVTAVFAAAAFFKQREEVRTLQQEAKDQQALIEQQGELLKIQAGQLDIQRQQLDEQRAINEKQAEVAALQAQELRESLDERKHEADARRRAQASRVFIHEERLDADPRIPQASRTARGEQPQPVVVAHVMNASQQPVYNVIISWHLGTMPKGRHCLKALMPDAEDKDIQPVPPGAPPEKFGAVAFFRDAAGVTWRTRPDGQLDEVPPGQEPPHTW
jgi:hypothetical protein